MDMKKLIAGIVQVADMAAVVLPQAKLVGGAAQMGGKILDVIDGLKDQGDSDDQAAMQEARAKLATAVKAKAAATSDRLRG